ncbi:hypothetical protein EVAR_70668_1 [Eumeta japonica]|uniref:Uncharacterized protein n=1 Tax=Eumeta variegata TaxID=151549 RepID=A0A4C2ADE4_EUMVA|nr:hypothetical protein EVAR_70668_1 [Eumeta japonica]
MPKSQIEQNSTALTLENTTPQTPTTPLTTTPVNVVTTQITKDTIATILERDNLNENILDSALNLKTEETTQTSKKTSQLQAAIDNLEIKMQ